MKRWTKEREYRWQARLLTLGLIVGLIYFAVVNPAALSPTWVAVCGLVLTAVSRFYGIRGDKDDDDKDDESS